MLRIETAMILFGALLLLVLPASWLLAAVVASVIHELCHIGAVWLLGGTVSGIRVDVGMAKIEARLPDRGKAILAALAGPAGSLLLLICVKWMPQIAICGCIQGLYNLIPIYPLDGGRALRYLLERLCPKKAECVQLWVEAAVSGVLFLAAVYGAFGLSLGLWPVFAALLPISNLIRRKIPCKRRQMRVQ